MTDEWRYIGDIGVEAATVAFWDRSQLPVSFRFSATEAPPPLPKVAVSNVGDDIDGAVEVNLGDQTTRLRVVFVDDVDELEQDWKTLGELHLPSGNLVVADPYCSPVVRYRQEWNVRPGWWVVEELYWEGDLEAVRLGWTRET